MASAQEPEVQFAQRLASNEKPVRTKAIKKLKKYIHVRSQKAADGFTPDELLKLWKGLFYCLWMQDKPLMQEQLSNQISSLIHSFQDVDGQLLFVQSFLQTFKREWTGIDRLRMDKFFQLIRFMFRQTFQMLKKTSWDSSVVSRFLELLAAQLLQAGSEAPCGLQLHILDVYMSELAAVAADELTADQNLTLISPFCKTAARTKDRTLFRAICSSIFSTIVEQAPFAIEDLMKELEAGSDSEEEHSDTDPREEVEQPQMNGRKSKEDDEESEASDAAGEEDMGPVLQFDYGALAAKLFELAGRSNTPTHNRQKLYDIVKVLRNLSEGIFPQHEYPEEVSTDEDDDMFGSRKRMKRRRRTSEDGDEEEEPAKKNKKKKKGSSTLNEQNEESSDSPANQKKKRKRKRKKKSEEGGCDQDAAVRTTTEEEPPDRVSGEDAPELQERTNTSPSDVPSEKNLEEAQVHGAAAPTPGKKRRKRKMKKGGAASVDVPSATGEAADVSEREESALKDAPTPAKKKKRALEAEEPLSTTKPKKTKKKKLSAAENAADGEVDAAAPPGGQPEGSTALTQQQVKKTKKKKLSAAENAADGEGDAAAPPGGQPDSSTTLTQQVKKKKKKKKIPVVFEFEADELAASMDQTAKAKKKPQKKKKATESDFVTFQPKAAAPTPLFCRTKGGASRKPQTPKSDSKKVTFGLTNNKTAEFRKSDRSLLVSPDGSSRVPFDPHQKPKCGVLKSAARGRNRTMTRPRPKAADFF